MTRWFPLLLLLIYLVAEILGIRVLIRITLLMLLLLAAADRRLLLSVIFAAQ